MNQSKQLVNAHLENALGAIVQVSERLDGKDIARALEIIQAMQIMLSLQLYQLRGAIQISFVSAEKMQEQISKFLHGRKQ